MSGNLFHNSADMHSIGCLKIWHRRVDYRYVSYIEPRIRGIISYQRAQRREHGHRADPVPYRTFSEA